jgi:aminoglycoside 3-N-acetyltransferase
MPVTLYDIAAAVRQAGLAEKPIGLHASLSSFGWVEGGANTVIQALLGSGCTVMVPTHAYQRYAVPPPGHRVTRRRAPLYTPESNALDAENMGAIPTAVLRRPGRVRGDHPLDSFTAVGGQAHALIDGQTPQDVYAPIRALASLGGDLVLMGVGLNRLTALHHAERMAGRALFHLWALGPDGAPMRVDIGGCSEGFVNLAPVLQPLERRVQVGQSLWRIFPAATLLEAAAEAIVRTPAITHCGNPRCGECKVNVQMTGTRVDRGMLAP